MDALAHLAPRPSWRRRTVRRLRPVIRLTRRAAGWFANLRQTDRAELVRAHFGSFDCPTPFAPDVPAATVRAAFRRCYPRHRIAVTRS